MGMIYNRLGANIQYFVRIRFASVWLVFFFATMSAALEFRILGCFSVIAA